MEPKALGKEELERWREVLQRKLQEANEELEYSRKELESGLSNSSGENSTYSLHMADQGTDAQEREKMMMFAHRQGKFIKTIEAALERVEAGTYGLCIVCGAHIGDGRLKVVPTAKTCIEHKE